MRGDTDLDPGYGALRTPPTVIDRPGEVRLGVLVPLGFQ